MKRRTPKPGRGEEGVAYVVVLLLLLMMVSMGLSFILQASVQLTTTAGRSENMKAEYLAEAAANHALWRPINEPTFPAATDKYYMHSLGEGRFGYKVRRHTGTTFATIAAVGAVGEHTAEQGYVVYIPANASSNVVYEAFAEAIPDSGLESITIAIPTDTAKDSLLVAAIATDGDTSATLAPPGGEGWTQISISHHVNEVTLGVWWKFADASESVTHQFTWTGVHNAYGWIMRFEGHDTTTPINAFAIGGESSDAPDSASATSTVTNGLILRLGAFDGAYITEDDPGLTGHTPITMDKDDSAAPAQAGTIVQSPMSRESSGSNSFTLSMPSPSPDGDLYIAQIGKESASSINSVPSGWTVIEDGQSGGATRFATYYRIGDSEPADYTWGSGSSGKWIGVIHRVSGVDTANPINASAKSTGDSSSPNAPTVTTTVDDAVIFRLYGAEGDEQKSNYWPSGTTAIWQDDTEGNVVGGGVYSEQTTAGSTGSAAFSMSGSKKWVAVTIAVAP